jgi:hypothetical protein
MRFTACTIRPDRQANRLLGRDVPVAPAEDGPLQADEQGKPAAARSTRSYIMRAFGDRLAQVREAVAAPAASLPPDELNRADFRICERFRPEVPDGTAEWGAKGALRGERIIALIGEGAGAADGSGHAWRQSLPSRAIMRDKQKGQDYGEPGT